VYTPKMILSKLQFSYDNFYLVTVIKSNCKKIVKAKKKIDF